MTSVREEFDIRHIQRRLCRWRTSLLISIVLLYVKYNLANKISFDNKFFIVFFLCVCVVIH